MRRHIDDFAVSDFNSARRSTRRTYIAGNGDSGNVVVGECLYKIFPVTDADSPITNGRIIVEELEVESEGVGDFLAAAGFLRRGAAVSARGRCHEDILVDVFDEVDVGVVSKVFHETKSPL